MAYKSLFDRIGRDDPLFRRGCSRMEYSGTLEGVLSETEESLFLSMRGEQSLRLALHAPRIIRALVDFKVQNPSENAEALIRDAIKLGLDIYRGVGAIDLIGRLRKKVKETGNQRVLDEELKQPLDNTTWEATRPARSRATVEEIAAQTRGDDVLFIALAHGGVAAGMDAYLRYCEKVGSTNSAFYVARFSTQKLKDETPQLSQSEIAYLQEQSRGRRVVIFDEDSATGNTLRKAYNFFTENVFYSKILIIAANIDTIKELLRAGHVGKIAQIGHSGKSINEQHKKISELYDTGILGLDSLVDLGYSDDRGKGSKIIPEIYPTKMDYASSLIYSYSASKH